VIHYIDTQVMVWLCEGKLEKLSAPAAAVLEETEAVISPMVLLELEYLYGIKRILVPPQELLTGIEAQIGLRVRDHSFAAVIRTALFETWTRDPFDRVIVAQAKADGMAPLVTSDQKIQRNYPQAVW
jgi:PIN domain nuclease of toxin-antitoxin system